MLKKFIKDKNKKILFTPGPSSLSYENIKGLAPGFGRGDNEYLKVENIWIYFYTKRIFYQLCLKLQLDNYFCLD